ncbi:DNA polymerase III subunit alpha [Arthrobacter sp. Hiyo4]|nr:DNA polymerase III subunit alpha [Arthrobacter sp. Hiyo4]
MTLLSYNNVGMRNLFRASSIGSLDAVFGKWPRLDRELLNTYAEGLIATTGCPSGRSRPGCGWASTARPWKPPRNSGTFSVRRTISAN